MTARKKKPAAPAVAANTAPTARAADCKSGLHPGWENRRSEGGRQTGLRCVACRVWWPGRRLPTPLDAAARNPGFGELADQPSWAARIVTMTAELHRPESQ